MKAHCRSECGAALEPAVVLCLIGLLTSHLELVKMASRSIHYDIRNVILSVIRRISIYLSYYVWLNVYTI